MAMVVIVSLSSSLHSTSPPLRFRPPPDPPPSSLSFSMSFETFSQPPVSLVLVSWEALSQLKLPDPPPCSSLRVTFEALSPPEPPDPPDASFRLGVHLYFGTPLTLSQAFSKTRNLETQFPNLANSGGVVSFVFFEATRCGVVLLADVVFGVVTVLLPFIPSPLDLTHISTLKLPSWRATRNVGDGGLLVSASDNSHVYELHSHVVYMNLLECNDTSFAYGFHSPVIYRSLFGCVDWPSINPCFDLPTTTPCKVLHAHLSFLSTYSATVEWLRQLSVWVMLELRFMILFGDIPMDLVSFGSIFATSSSIYIALAQSSAVCSSLTGSIPDVGVVFVYFYSLWQVEDKLIVTCIPMNMDMAGYDLALVPRLNQSPFLIFPPIWSELDEQASLVLQGSSSLRMLSAYGAVCVVLRVTLDAVFDEAYDVVIRFHMVSSCDLYRHSIPYLVVLFVWLAIASLYPLLLECKLI